MVEVKLEWNKDNLKEYIKFSSFNNKPVKIALPVFAACYAAMLVVCILMAVKFGYWIMLGAALMITFFALIFAAITFFSFKGYVKNAIKANSDSDINNILICTDALLLLKDDEPIGTIDYRNINEISFNEKAETAYIITNKNAVIILEYKNIVLGTKEELKKILEEKQSELSKKA